VKPSDLAILHEDNHILAVNKPAGLLTQAYGSPRENLEDLARLWIKIEKKKPGDVFLHVVGRLDKAVSGVVLFARTGKALSRLNAAVRRKQVLRVYHAVVAGTPKPRSGVLRNWTRHGSHRAEIAGAGQEGAKEAVLEYRFVREAKGRSLLEVRLHTGRYHQIRIQLASAGVPILGDGKYGGLRGDLPGHAIGLHHIVTEFEHPVRKEPVRIEAAYPPYWPDV
jgi:23S rRNA pseudouridine1911/1915/1917 synthase